MGLVQMGGEHLKKPKVGSLLFIKKSPEELRAKSVFSSRIGGTLLGIHNL